MCVYLYVYVCVYLWLIWDGLGETPPLTPSLLSIYLSHIEDVELGLKGRLSQDEGKPDGPPYRPSSDTDTYTYTGTGTYTHRISGSFADLTHAARLADLTRLAKTIMVLAMKEPWGGQSQGSLGCGLLLGILREQERIRGILIRFRERGVFGQEGFSSRQQPLERGDGSFTASSLADLERVFGKIT